MFNREELAVIKKLSNLAKKWPKTLMLYAGNGNLEVIRCEDFGTYVNGVGGQDQVETYHIPNIRCDGGDPS